jgi:hypothetical protein
MILNEQRNEGAVSNVPKNFQGQFTIAANGKAFDILSSTLYQDKIGSIVREICCNAFDSHRENGNPDTPFEIHLPSVVEPYFSVKDYGVGMDADTVRNVFTSLFVSTKENSNEAVGAFGLGSKTPFSYADTFNVIAIKNGISRTFSMYKNEDGTPIHSLLLEKDTDEPNGVEIIIPVNNLSDRAEFARAIVRQLHFFPIRPIIKGGDYCVNWLKEPTDSDIFVKYKNITLFKNGNYRNGVFVVMGPVGYELNFNILADKLRKYEKVICWLYNRIARIYFNIGDISVTPSRENLSYDSKTIRAFEKTFDGFLEEIVGTFENNLSVFKTPWERAQFIIQSNSDVADLIKIKSDKDKDGIIRYHGHYAYFDTQSIKEEMGDNACEIVIKKVDSFINGRNKFSVSRATILDIVNTSKFVVIADSCKHVTRRYMTLNNKFDSRNCYVIVPSDLSKSKLIKEIFEKSGIPTKLISEIEPTDVTKLYSFVKTHGYFVSYDDLKSSKDLFKTRYGWNKIVDKTVIEPSFYIQADNGIVNNYEVICRFRTLANLNLISEEYQIPLYAFNNKIIQKIEKDNNWISIEKYVKENFNDDKMNQIFSDTWESITYLNALNRLKNYGNLSDSVLLKTDYVKNWLDDIELKFKDKIELVSKYDSKSFKIILSEMKDKKYKNMENIIFNYITKDFKNLKTYYPLLKHINPYADTFSGLYDDFNEYSNMYNKKHGIPKLSVIDLNELQTLLTANT